MFYELFPKELNNALQEVLKIFQKKSKLTKYFIRLEINKND